MSTVATVSGEARIRMQRQTVADHLQGECSGDWEKVARTFVQAPRAYYEVVPGGLHFDGSDGVREFYDLLAVVLPDLNVTVTHEYDVPGCCIRELTATGTQSAAFFGVEPKGNFVSFEVCALYIFDMEQPDKLIAERAYWDNDGLLRQMRGETVPRLGLADHSRR